MDFISISNRIHKFLNRGISIDRKLATDYLIGRGWWVGLLRMRHMWKYWSVLGIPAMIFNSLQVGGFVAVVVLRSQCSLIVAEHRQHLCLVLWMKPLKESFGVTFPTLAPSIHQKVPTSSSLHVSTWFIISLLPWSRPPHTLHFHWSIR